MKQQSVEREPVFNDQVFAERYARKHRGMAQKFADVYGSKLGKRGFAEGRILDAGCGFGDTLIALIENFPQAEGSGIDLSEPLLDMAEKHAAESGLSNRVRFMKADVMEIPFPDNNFDVILNLNMVHLVADPLKMFNEMERVLKPEGILFVADIRRSWVGILEKEFKSGLSVKEADDLIAQSGMRKGAITSSFLWWRFEV